MRGRGWVVVMLGAACGPGLAGSDATTAGSSGEVVTSAPTEGSGESVGASGTTEGSTEAVSSGSTTEEMFDCGEFPTPYAMSPASVVLVVEKSDSMLTLWDHDNDDPDGDGFNDDMAPATPEQTRWKSVHQELAAFVALGGAMNKGLCLFPAKSATSTYSAAACPVDSPIDVAVGPMHEAALLAALPDEDSVALGGASPTTAAVQAALAELLGGAPGKKSLVLLTDGAPNCRAGAADAATLLETYDAGLVTAVADARAQGVVTHVVGLDIANGESDDAQDSEPDHTNARNRLTEVAVAGGAPWQWQFKFHDARDQSLLAHSLATLAELTLDCTVMLSEPAVYPESVEIEIDGVSWGQPYVYDCATEDGWLYADETKTVVQMCGQMCAQFGAVGVMEVAYRCPVD